MTPRVSLALVMIFVAGVVVRLLPWLIDPAIALRDDAAFHVRMVRAVVETGRVPEIDRLSNAPEGRRTHDHLPLGLYYAAAAFHRVLGPIDHAGVRTHVIVFIALAGALIIFPVFLAARALGASAGAALLAALVAGLLPAYLHRTFGHWVRYDALGTTLILGQAAFALRALRETRHRVWDALASVAFMIAAACVWRVSLTFPILESGWLLLALAVRGSDRCQRELFLVLAAGGSAAFALLDPMRSQNFAASPPWLFVVAVACAALIARAERPVMARLAVVIAVITLVGVAGRLLPTNTYASTYDLFALKVRQMTSGASHSTALMRLRLDVIELYGMTPLALLVGREQFLALGPWCLGAFALLAWRMVRTPSRAPASIASGLGMALVVGVAGTVFTLAFARNKALLGPWVAVACGLVADALWRPPGPTPRARSRRGATDTPRTSPARTALRALFVASIVATCATGILLAQSRRAVYPRDLLRAYEFLRTQSPAGAIVAAPWWLGYEIQALGERATIVDGLLESPDNETRILELHAAFLDRDPETLLRVCRAHHVTHVLVPDPEEISNVAWITDPDLVRAIESGRPASAQDLSRTIIRMMRRERVAGFQSALETESVRVLSVAP